MVAPRQAGTLDDETQHYVRVLKVKQARLRILDEQAAALGEYNVPPHIEMERQSLMDELGMIEFAIAAPARAEVTEQLGPAGRFLVNHQQYREVKQSLAAISVKIEQGFAMHRQWIMIIGVAVLLILVAVVAIVTAIALRGGL